MFQISKTSENQLGVTQHRSGCTVGCALFCLQTNVTDLWFSSALSPSVGCADHSRKEWYSKQMTCRVEISSWSKRNNFSVYLQVSICELVIKGYTAIQLTQKQTCTGDGWTLPGDSSECSDQMSTDYSQCNLRSNWVSKKSMYVWQGWHSTYGTSLPIRSSSWSPGGRLEYFKQCWTPTRGQLNQVSEHWCFNL